MSDDSSTSESFAPIMKVISIGSLILISLIGGIVPVRLAKWFPSGKSISLANCFSAGVLIGAALVHLLADAEPSGEECGGFCFEYPLAHLMCGVGFFVALVLEKGFTHSHSHGEKNEKNTLELETVADMSENHEDENEEEHGHSHKKVKQRKTKENLSLSENASPVELTEKEESNNLNENNIHNHNDSENHEHEHLNELEHNEDSVGHGHSHNSKESSKSKKAKSRKNKSKQGGGDSHHEHNFETHSPNSIRKQPNWTAVYILSAVLGLESFISGSALGIAEETKQVVAVFVAIISHIWAEAFALTANCVKNNLTDKQTYIVLVLWSCLAPGGIAVGWLLHNVLTGTVAILVKSILVALASGTFLYVAIVELIVEEFNSEELKRIKLFLLILGFGLLSVLGFWL